MKNTVLHKANTRGHADHGWLNAYHSFSFARWYDPNRVQFGMLRVLNDDTIAAGMGFGTHPHDNMEIITIPIEGDLAHKDSMGNAETIKTGDIQVMSAGTGVEHSEYNPNKEARTKLFQIWIFPKVKNITPRYQQITLNPEDSINKLQQILSPNPEDEGAWIYQDAWFHLGKFNKEMTLEYPIRKEGNGVYAFVIQGNATIDGQKLETRDGFGIWNTNKLLIDVSKDTQLLLIDVPMEY